VEKKENWGHQTGAKLRQKGWGERKSCGARIREAKKKEAAPDCFLSQSESEEKKGALETGNGSKKKRKKEKRRQS